MVSVSIPFNNPALQETLWVRNTGSNMDLFMSLLSLHRPSRPCLMRLRSRTPKSSSDEEGATDGKHKHTHRRTQEVCTHARRRTQEVCTHADVRKKCARMQTYARGAQANMAADIHKKCACTQTIRRKRAYILDGERFFGVDVIAAARCLCLKL